MSMKDKLFPDRPQDYNFPTERKAIQAARAVIGAKANQGLAFIICKDGGTWGWIGASSHEYGIASIAKAAQNV
jgi:hypothetical protein